MLVANSRNWSFCIGIFTNFSATAPNSSIELLAFCMTSLACEILILLDAVCRILKLLFLEFLVCAGI